MVAPGDYFVSYGRQLAQPRLPRWLLVARYISFFHVARVADLTWPFLTQGGWPRMPLPALRAIGH